MDGRRKNGSAHLAFIVLIISLIPLTAQSAQKIVAGTACKTLNSKATTNNKIYTCIKKGSKLIWNNGVAIKSAAPTKSPTPLTTNSPNPTPSSAPARIDELSRDSRISNASLLSNVGICKTVDNTPDFIAREKISRNGFPRPKDALYPSGKVKILVIPFNYKSWSFNPPLRQGSNQTMTDLDLLKAMIKEAEQFYREISGGRFEASFSVLPEKEWWTMDPDSAFNTAQYADNFGPFKKMIEQNDGKVDFTEFDSYIFVSSSISTIVPIAQAEFMSGIKTSKGQANKLVAMTVSWQNYQVVFHELGHSLFGLEDLYLQSESSAEWLPRELKVALGWEIMANSSLSQLTNWNRLLMGWIPDGEIRCLTEQAESVHYLTGTPAKNEPKILLINLAPGVSLVGESRTTGSSQGLLLYVVDTNLSHGRGPMRALNSLINVGDSKDLFDWQFKVLDSNKEGLIVQVKKGSGMAYSPPNSGQANQGGEDRPRPRMGEIVPTSYLQARSTWEISNYKSYRIFITTVEEPNRILFDTGIVNDSRDPLVVEVSGLVCGKDFMTTTQFWTERDGKGTKEQISSGQLRKFECK